MSQVKIESGIPMPTTVRPHKGDSRLNAIKDGMDQLNKEGQSFLLPMKNLEQATDERRHYVNRANKYGKLHGKEFVVAAVDGQPANPEKGIEATKPGIRIWLSKLEQAEPEAGAENGTEQAEETTEKVAAVNAEAPVADVAA